MLDLFNRLMIVEDIDSVFFFFDLFKLIDNNNIV